MTISSLNEISNTDLGKEMICDFQVDKQTLSIRNLIKGVNSKYDRKNGGIIEVNQTVDFIHDGVRFNKPHIILGHEIAHAWQHMIGGYKKEMEKSWNGTDVQMAEIFAVRFENYLRAFNGETKMRMKYSGVSLDGRHWPRIDIFQDSEGFMGSSPEYFKSMMMPLTKYERAEIQPYKPSTGPPSVIPQAMKDNLNKAVDTTRYYKFGQ